MVSDSIFADGENSASQGNDAMRHRPECQHNAMPGQRSLMQRDGSRSSRPPGTWIRCAVGRRLPSRVARAAYGRKRRILFRLRGRSDPVAGTRVERRLSPSLRARQCGRLSGSGSV